MIALVIPAEGELVQDVKLGKGSEEREAGG